MIREILRGEALAGVTSRRKTPRPHGQSLTEFALVAPLFLLMMMAVVDLGRGVFFYNMLSNVARDGARAGVVNSTTTALNQMCLRVFAEAQLPDVTSPACPGSGMTSATVPAGALTATLNAGVAGNPGASPPSSGTPNQVTLTYAFTPVTPFIDAVVGLAAGGSITLTASSQMYVEN
jgi:Flp pilus assembly protein TadG